MNKKVEAGEVFEVSGTLVKKFQALRNYAFYPDWDSMPVPEGDEYQLHIEQSEANQQKIRGALGMVDVWMGQQNRPVEGERITLELVWDLVPASPEVDQTRRPLESIHEDEDEDEFEDEVPLVDMTDDELLGL